MIWGAQELAIPRVIRQNHLHVPDPDALAAEYASRGVEFFQPLKDDDDRLRGFEAKDAAGDVLFFGSPLSPIMPNNVLQATKSSISRDASNVGAALVYRKRSNVAA